MRKLCYLSFDPAHFPCARYRVLDPLERHRDSIALLHGINSVSNHTVEANTDAILGADAFLIQRSFVTPATVGFIDDLLRSGRPVMFETDDDLSVIPDWHNKPHHKESAKLAEPLLGRFAVITVSTEILAERYRPHNGNVRIVPNHLNEMLWAAARDGTVPGAPNRGNVRVGLIGSTGHSRDFERISAVLARQLDRCPGLHVVFKGMDPGSIGLSHPRVSSIAPNMDYGRFVSDFVRLNFDIVLAPLIDHPFNRGKSDVKWLEAGFCAIPGVFENLPPYSGSIEHGETGFLAGSESDWEDALAALIYDPALRQRIGDAARERILRDRVLLTRSGDRLASIDALFGI